MLRGARCGHEEILGEWEGALEVRWAKASAMGADAGPLGGWRRGKKDIDRRLRWVQSSLETMENRGETEKFHLDKEWIEHWFDIDAGCLAQGV